MNRFIPLIGISLLLLGAIVTWRLIDRSTVPETPKTQVTVPEGWTVDQINNLLKEKGVLTEGELPQEAEGYLFPDTYEFFLGSSVEVVRGRFLDNFHRQLEKVGLNSDDEGFYGDLIMASLLEREIKDYGEKRVAAGVLWKRIDVGVALQVDATLCYIKPTDKCLPITSADKKIDSSYNTYLYRGLPPGPIGNPGIESILAATKPVDSPYWYYISDQKTGKTIFAETLDEHNLNIVKYLNE